MKEKLSMKTYTQDVQKLATFLEDAFNNPSVVQILTRKPHTCVVAPHNINVKNLKYALASVNKTHQIPEFDSTNLWKDNDFQECVALDIFDGQLLLGEYHREEDGTTTYQQRTHHMYRKYKTLDTRNYQLIHLHTTSAIDAFCKLRGKVKTKENKDLLTEFVLHAGQVWCRTLTPKTSWPAIQVTQATIEKGITKLYNDIRPDCPLLESGYQPTGNPLQVGDYIIKMDIGKHVHYRLITQDEATQEWIIK